MKFIIILLTGLLGMNVLAASPKITLTKDNTVALLDYVDWDTVAKVNTKAKELDARLPSKEPIYLVLSTGGGDIDAGIEMIENLSHLNRPVHTITLFSASMGFQTVQGLGWRYITENGTLMTHKARGGFDGEFPGQVDSRYSYYLKRIMHLDEKVVSRTKGKHTLQSYHNLMENEYWCDGKDCLTQGFADLVVAPACDKSLDGTREEVVKLFFMGMPVTINLVMAACPLTTGVLDYTVNVNGRDVFKSDYSYYETDLKLTKDEIKALNEKVTSIITQKSTRRKEVKRY